MRMCESAINRLQKRPPKWQTQCSKLIWSNYLVCNESESTSLELPPLAPWFLGAGHSQWLVLCPRRVGRGPGCRLHPVHRPLAPHTVRRPDRWQPPPCRCVQGLAPHWGGPTVCQRFQSSRYYPNLLGPWPRGQLLGYVFPKPRLAPRVETSIFPLLRGFQTFRILTSFS